MSSVAFFPSSVRLSLDVLPFPTADFKYLAFVPANACQRPFFQGFESEKDILGNLDRRPTRRDRQQGAFAVQVGALRMEMRQILAGLPVRDRPVGALMFYTHPYRIEWGIDEDRDGLFAEEITVRPSQDDSSSRSDYGRRTDGSDGGENGSLDFAKRRFPAFCEDIRDGPPGGGHHFVIDIVERPLKGFGKASPDGRLSGAHEADENEGEIRAYRHEML